MSLARSRLTEFLYSTRSHAATPCTVGVAAVAISAVMLLTKLDAFPPFIDEAVYARWAVRLAESPSADTLWLSTHEDWKTPAFMWALAVAYRWLDDAILTGRLITSLSGVLTVAIVYWAGVRLIGAWPAATAAIVIAVSPALVFTNRLALTDTLIVMLTALIWGLSIPAARGYGPAAFGAGSTVALALWIKLSGALLLVIPLAGILLASQATLRCRTKSLAFLLTPPSAACIAFLLAPKSAQTFQHARGFVLTPDRLVAIPMDQWAENLSQMGGWALAYLPGISIIAAAAALVLPFVTRRREDWWLWAVLVFWLAFHVLFGAKLYSRYALPALVPLALLTARTIAAIGDAVRHADRERLAFLWMVGASLAVVISLAIPAIAARRRADPGPPSPGTTARSTSKQWSVGFRTGGGVCNGSPIQQPRSQAPPLS